VLKQKAQKDYVVRRAVLTPSAIAPNISRMPNSAAPGASSVSSDVDPDGGLGPADGILDVRQCATVKQHYERLLRYFDTLDPALRWALFLPVGIGFSFVILSVVDAGFAMAQAPYRRVPA
jgi:hypothetical protein